MRETAHIRVNPAAAERLLVGIDHHTATFADHIERTANEPDVVLKIPTADLDLHGLVSMLHGQNAGTSENTKIGVISEYQPAIKYTGIRSR